LTKASSGSTSAPVRPSANPGTPGRDELTGRLHGVERGHDHVVYQTDAEDTA
jgi:hypothetical protein